MKSFRALLICLFSIAFTLPASSADRMKTDKATGCRIEAPQSWENYAVQWIGACVSNLADGSGVLKGLNKGKVQELFYGHVKQGILEIGVIESDRGYVAGRFNEGEPVQSEDRQTYIQAFREGVASANQASDYYRQKGNAASAKYYAQKAKALDQQMD
jgi:hypothetical protein